MAVYLVTITSKQCEKVVKEVLQFIFNCHVAFDCQIAFTLDSIKWFVARETKYETAG